MKQITHAYQPRNGSYPDYPDVLTPEEPEEDNPTAYALLSEIKDPYYANTERSSGSFHEGTAQSDDNLGDREQVEPADLQNVLRHDS